MVWHPSRLVILHMGQNSAFARIKWMIILLLCMLLDTLPVPILGFILLYVLIFRPLWFKNAVMDIYNHKNGNHDLR